MNQQFKKPTRFFSIKETSVGLQVFLKRDALELMRNLPTAPIFSDWNTFKSKDPSSPLKNHELIKVLGRKRPDAISDFCREMGSHGYGEEDVHAYLNFVNSGNETHKSGRQGSSTMPRALTFRQAETFVPTKDVLIPWKTKIVECGVRSWVRFYTTGEFEGNLSYAYSGRCG